MSARAFLSAQALGESSNFAGVKSALSAAGIIIIGAGNTNGRARRASQNTAWREPRYSTHARAKRAAPRAREGIYSRCAHARARVAAAAVSPYFMPAAARRVYPYIGNWNSTIDTESRRGERLSRARERADKKKERVCVHNRHVENVGISSCCLWRHRGTRKDRNCARNITGLWGEQREISFQWCIHEGFIGDEVSARRCVWGRNGEWDWVFFLRTSVWILGVDWESYERIAFERNNVYEFCGLLGYNTNWIILIKYFTSLVTITLWFLSLQISSANVGVE